jgi:hypothetical protein
MNDNLFYQIADELFKESISVDLDATYELFQRDYLQATGKTWTKDKFLDRARNWTFYGTKDGVVAVRFQRSGFVKLVGTAGSAKGKYVGIQQLLQERLPVWGFISKDMLPMAHKMSFHTPPSFVIKIVLKSIDAATFGNVPFEVNSDGSIKLHYYDVGISDKYFIATKEYYLKFLKIFGQKITQPIINIINKIIGRK